MSKDTLHRQLIRYQTYYYLKQNKMKSDKVHISTLQYIPAYPDFDHVLIFAAHGFQRYMYQMTLHISATLVLRLYRRKLPSNRHERLPQVLGNLVSNLKVFSASLCLSPVCTPPTSLKISSSGSWNFPIPSVLHFGTFQPVLIVRPPHMRQLPITLCLPIQSIKSHFTIRKKQEIHSTAR